MRRPARIVILAAVLLLPAVSFAADVYVNPLRLAPSNLIFTHVAIDGKAVLALIDTGSFRAIQLSSTLARDLGLTLTQTTRIATRHDGKPLFLKSGRVDRFTIGTYERRNVEIDVIEGDIEGITGQVGMEFQAIVGWGFLSRYHTVLDLKNLSMQISEGFLPVPYNAFTMTYVVTSGVPVIKGAIGAQEARFLFDTGAPMSTLDLGVAGTQDGEKVLREVLLGRSRVALEFQAKDLSVIKKSLGCVGIIGNNLLRGRTVYIDTTGNGIHLY
jgi:hypothetical protein